MHLKSFFLPGRIPGSVLVFLSIPVLLGGCAGKPPAPPAAAAQTAPAKPRKKVAQAAAQPAEPDYRPAPRFPGAPLWKWESWTRDGQVHAVSKPGHYTIQLLANGWFKFAAECLRGEGIYEMQNDRIAIAVTQANPGKCHAGPMAEHFVQALEEASSYHQTAKRLTLDLGRNEGSLSFSRSD